VLAAFTARFLAVAATFNGTAFGGPTCALVNRAPRPFARFYKGEEMKQFARIGIALTLLLALAGVAGAQSWTPIVNQPPSFLPGVMLQLRDGRIIMHDEGGTVATDWWVLTPDASGSYVNGTWSYGGALPTGYQPLYFGSQVFMDGHTVVIEGGEYNFAVSETNGVWTTLGARLTYSGNSFTWVSNDPPTGWTTIGDAESILLADGKYMQANCCTAQNAIYNGPNSWITTGSVIQRNNDESGFTLLPNGQVLTVDAKNNATCASSPRWCGALHRYQSCDWRWILGVHRLNSYSAV
jgi:hypothetical protein